MSPHRDRSVPPDSEQPPPATATPPGLRRPPVRFSSAPPAALDLLGRARRGLTTAAAAVHPCERYAGAHLAALRAAAAVLAARARPEEDTDRRRRPPRLRTAWELLAHIAPELTEWAAFFAAGAHRRAAAEAGQAGAVSAREADDLLRDVEVFLGLVTRTLGLPAEERRPPASVRT